MQDDGGTAGGRVDLDPTPATFTWNVVATGDPPTGFNFSRTLPEDNFYTFSVSDFPFTDADNPPNNLCAIHITTLPTNGTLLVNGVAVYVGDYVTKDQLAAGQVRYLPPANNWGTPLSAFTFQVQDDGGTANGGIDLDRYRRQPRWLSRL